MGSTSSARQTNDADIVILGGGPAGAISAWLAARDGLSTVLIDPCRGSGRIEGLSPRLRLWLGRTGLGCGDAVIGPFPRAVDWGEGVAERNDECVVDRGRLDEHLRRRACAAGARLVVGVAAIDGRSVRLADGRRLSASWVVDARGRRGHRPGRDAAPFANLSICGWVEGGAASRPGLSIAALAEGWLWTAALPDGRRWAQFTGDARDKAPLDARLRAALRAAFPEETGLSPVGRLHAMRSNPILPELPEEGGGMRRLAVGDALAAMDPLSGAGVFWAASSALAASAVRRTLDARPGPESLALCRAYLQRRALDGYFRNARTGRDFIRLEGRFAERPFWRARRDFPDDAPAHGPASAPAIARRPVIRDGLVEEMEVLTTPEDPEGVGWFGAVPAAPLWRMTRAGAPEAAILARFGPQAAAALRALRTSVGAADPGA